jgi:membrane associated rhomboid family serine protease
MPPLPPVTKFLLLLCTAVFCMQLLAPIHMWLALWPVGSGYFFPWQPITYAFLHGGYAHLFFNGLALWMFGGELEQLWGGRRYRQFVAVGILAAAALQLLFTGLAGIHSPTVGISGAIFGLLVAYGMVWPDRMVIAFPVPVPVKARYLVWIVGAVDLVLGFAMAGGIAHFAHLGGALGGYLMILYWRGHPPFGGRKGPRRLH